MTDKYQSMTALQLGAAIGEGEIDPVDLTEYFLTRIEQLDPDNIVFITVTGTRARAEAMAARERAATGMRLGPLDGVPISWKDLVDSAGIATTGASELFRDRVPTRDALILARATRAGMVCLGKTNLSEFAFSGLGINPAYGTPVNPYDIETPRCPGGSSAGSAVSVASGMAPITIGTDTGGSVRIPAAWNNLVGLKTTAGVVSLKGVLPLSRQYDTAGPLAQDVADAAALFAILCAAKPADLTGASLKGRRFLVAENCVWDGAEPALKAQVEKAIHALELAGAEIHRGKVPEFDSVTDLCNTLGNIFSPEAYAEWRTEIDNHGDKIHHEVMRRFKIADNMSALDTAEAFHKLRAFRGSYLRRVAGYDGVLMPSTPIFPPPIAPLENDTAAYAAANLSALHNTRLGNLLALSAITLPAGLVEHEGAQLPTSLMIYAAPRRENALLRVAKAAERAIANG